MHLKKYVIYIPGIKFLRHMKMYIIIKKPKIAVIGLKGLPAFGGAAAVGENIIEELKDIYDFTVYSTSSHTHLKTGYYNGYYQIVFKKLPLKKLNTLYYYIISAINALFHNYDLVHLHHRDAAFILTILKIKYKVIITTHSSFWVRDKWLTFKWFFEINEKYFVKKANIVTCVSLQEKRDYLNKINLDTIYIPNGIRVIKNIINDIFAQYKPYLFFGAGRIIKSKGLDVLLSALNYINYKGHLIVAGDLEQTPTYKKEILKLSESLNVIFIGLVKDKKELLSIIKNAHIFIFPSTMEAMSMMLLEGASVKTPIICSDIIQNRDIFNENEVLFFETENYIDLSNKIKYALNNYNEMISRSEKAFQKLNNEYNWKEIANSYSILYQKLINNG